MMKNWWPLAIGLLVGAFLGRIAAVPNAHACSPNCPTDESVVLEVSEVAGGREAQEFWIEGGARDAVVTPQYFLIAVGRGQVELGYGR